MNLLVVGTSGTGKTHYAGQLYGRLDKRESRLKLAAAPQNLSPFEDVLDRLSDGKTAAHTASLVYHQIPMHIIDNETGESGVLTWSDYAGEQIKNIARSRSVDAEWVERLKKSDGWLLFIRLNTIEKKEDLLSRPPGPMLGLRESDADAAVAEAAIGSDDEESKGSFPSIDQHVELLQILLAVSGRGTLNKLKKPALLILLSCWDELLQNKEVAESERPIAALERRMPLLAQFISSNWHEEVFAVYGLSSLGKSLDDEKADEEYRTLGPESFGYVVEPDGAMNQDLTLPVSALLKLAAANSSDAHLR